MLAVLVFASCDLLLGNDDGGVVTGDPCNVDTDCAPNACCGMGDAIVAASKAPDCSTAKCSGACPVTGIKCGCAVAVCRNSRCAPAISTAPNCP